MSDKALSFEDFVLDDYDFNVYTDWDLMDLWEWVEMEDFSDLQGGISHAEQQQYQQPSAPAPAPPPPPRAPPPPPPSPASQSNVDKIMSEASNNDDIQPDISSMADDLGLDLPDMGAGPNQSSNASASSAGHEDVQINHNAAPQGSSMDDFEADDDFDFDFDFDDDDDLTEAAAPSASIENPEHISAAAPAIDDDFDFNFDDDSETDFSDFETSDDLNLDMTSETDSLSDDDMDFDFSLEDDDSGFGSGGYASETEAAPAPQEAPPPADDDKEPRYIETSAGTLDIETDNILAFLQQLEFDEFLETLQLHPHVYDRIMPSDEWSKEEMEFLRSIEPLVKDAEKVAQIREQKAKEAEEEAEAAKHRMPDTTGYEGKDGSLYDPRACESLESMQQLLKDKALDSAQKNTRPITHMPKKLVSEWSVDNHKRQSSRVGRNFNKKLKATPKAEQKPWLKHVPNLPTIKTGKHERYYNELSSIINAELYAMCSNLDADSINFIKADGQRFGNQFTEFLLGKYGTKVLFLYRSQMENDLLADKMFEDFHDLFNKNLSPDSTEDYTQDFFRAILSQMHTHNIKI